MELVEYKFSIDILQSGLNGWLFYYCMLLIIDIM